MLSLKGPTGGFALARPADGIKLLEVVKAIDADDLFEKCAMGFPDCSSEAPCAIHEHWKQLRSGLEQVPANKGVAEVTHEMKRLNTGNGFTEFARVGSALMESTRFT